MVKDDFRVSWLILIFFLPTFWCIITAEIIPNNGGLLHFKYQTDVDAFLTIKAPSTGEVTIILFVVLSKDQLNSSMSLFLWIIHIIIYNDPYTIYLHNNKKKELSFKVTSCGNVVKKKKTIIITPLTGRRIGGASPTNSL